MVRSSLQKNAKILFPEDFYWPQEYNWLLFWAYGEYDCSVKMSTSRKDKEIGLNEHTLSQFWQENLNFEEFCKNCSQKLGSNNSATPLYNKI